jgi:hypothetical protein
MVGEGSDPQIARAGVDLVTDLVMPHIGANLRHDPREVVSEHERCLVLQEQFELAVADHLVERVDARSTHPDEHVLRPDGRPGHVGGAETARAVLLHDEGPHTST